jgi:hypothetical protein
VTFCAFGGQCFPLLVAPVSLPRNFRRRLTGYGCQWLEDQIHVRIFETSALPGRSARDLYHPSSRIDCLPVCMRACSWPGGHLKINRIGSNLAVKCLMYTSKAYQNPINCLMMRRNSRPSTRVCLLTDIGVGETVHLAVPRDAFDRVSSGRVEWFIDSTHRFPSPANFLCSRAKACLQVNWQMMDMSD